MQLTDALCYALLTITMTATCIQADERRTTESRRHELQERKVDRKFNRRDATILVDSLQESFHKPKVLYRKISKQRYGPAKSTYGPPRPKYNPPNPSRKPSKRYRGKISPKHTNKPLGHKKRAPKPKYGLPKRLITKPVYGPPQKKNPSSFSTNKYRPEPMGFGEPPSNFDDHRSPKPDYDDYLDQKPGFEEFEKYSKPSYSDFQKSSYSDFIKPNSKDFYKPGSKDFNEPGLDAFRKPVFDNFPQKLGYGEPPVDSYGAPVRANLHDLAQPTSHSFVDTATHFDQDIGFQSWKSYNKDQSTDNKYAFTHKLPFFKKPDENVFVTSVPVTETTEDLDLNTYSDIYIYKQMKDKIKKKPTYQNMKYMNQPWKMNSKQIDEEIIVGGQYAEPPARYVPKFQPSAPMFTDDEEFAPPGRLADPELVASATNSPYVNYKNSNMAFSPQNLNDAFSIVDM